METKNDGMANVDGFFMEPAPTEEQEQEFTALFSQLDAVTASDDLKAATLDAIFAAEGASDGAEVVPFEPTRNATRKRSGKRVRRTFKFALVAACLAAMCVGGVAYALPASHVTIGEGDTAVDIGVNVFGITVSADADTDEGKELLKDVDVRNMRYEDSIDKLVDKIEKAGQEKTAQQESEQQSSSSSSADSSSKQAGSKSSKKSTKSKSGKKSSKSKKSAAASADENEIAVSVSVQDADSKRREELEEGSKKKLEEKGYEQRGSAGKGAEGASGKQDGGAADKAKNDDPGTQTFIKEPEPQGDKGKGQPQDAQGQQGKRQQNDMPMKGMQQGGGSSAPSAPPDGRK